ncbi:hypothetical protein KIPE111705_31085 [Kibdelosporangium persicum]
MVLPRPAAARDRFPAGHQAGGAGDRPRRQPLHPGPRHAGRRRRRPDRGVAAERVARPDDPGGHTRNGFAHRVGRPPYAGFPRRDGECRRGAVPDAAPALDRHRLPRCLQRRRRHRQFSRQRHRSAVPCGRNRRWRRRRDRPRGQGRRGLPCRLPDSKPRAHRAARRGSPRRNRGDDERQGIRRSRRHRLGQRKRDHAASAFSGAVHRPDPIGHCGHRGARTSARDAGSVRNPAQPRDTAFRQGRSRPAVRRVAGTQWAQRTQAAAADPVRATAGRPEGRRCPAGDRDRDAQRPDPGRPEAAPGRRAVAGGRARTHRTAVAHRTADRVRASSGRADRGHGALARRARHFGGRPAEPAAGRALGDRPGRDHRNARALAAGGAEPVDRSQLHPGGSGAATNL